MKRRILFSLAPAVLLLAFGCGGGSNTSYVQGKVTFEGKPVTGGSMVFYSDTASFPAGIRDDGTYSITEIPPGEVTITVETESVNPKNKKPPTYDGGSGGGPGKGMYPGGGQPGGGGPGGPPKGPDGKKYSAGDGSPIPEGAHTAQGEYVKIPDRYADKAKSGIKKTIGSGKQTIDIELTP